MRIAESLPRAVREIEHCWIPMSDGCRLAARIWLPVGAERDPVPAVLEYLPYGKREGTRERDEPMHGYFAGHGYAAVRVDLRGSGDSEGILRDEYLEQERRDGVEVIAWIASREWCNGSVGILGKSWGGFNALQIAAARPPALRGAISVCASDDRYSDDAHYMGGCLLTENFRWGAFLFSLVAQPPDPALVGEGWRPLWQARLEAAEPLAPRWLRHPLRDAYWRQGSACEELDRVACPVYAIGGWADGYSNAVPRLLAGLPVARKGLVGPWGHLYPHEEGGPGPAIGFLQEALRWWEHCLRGSANGILDEPAYRVWMSAGGSEPGGRWVAEEEWPAARVSRRRLALGTEGLGRGGGDAERRVRSPQTTGLAAGGWCAFAAADLPGEQGPDDAGSLCFDSAPLRERLEILGAPAVELECRSDRPVGLVAVRLCDLDPEGRSQRVSYGLRNLSQDARHERWAPLVPGEPLRAEVTLNHVAHTFAAGHRLRVAISTAYWPLVWPSPEPVELRVRAGRSWLELPVRSARREDAALRPFEPPEVAPGPEIVALHPGGQRSEIRRDGPGGEVVVSNRFDLDERGRPSLSRVAPIDLEVGYGVWEEMRIRPDDPLSARAEFAHESVLRRGSWHVEVATRSLVTASRECFRVESELRASENGRRVFERRWDESVRREGI